MNHIEKLRELIKNGFTVSYPIRPKGKSIHKTSNSIQLKKEKDLYVIIDELANEMEERKVK